MVTHSSLCLKCVSINYYEELFHMTIDGKAKVPLVESTAWTSDSPGRQVNPESCRLLIDIWMRLDLAVLTIIMSEEPHWRRPHRSYWDTLHNPLLLWILSSDGIIFFEVWRKESRFSLMKPNSCTYKVSR